MAADRFGDPFFFLKKQLFWALLGGGLLWAALKLDYRSLERLVIPLLAVSFVLLVLVLVPPFGGSINGTRRWLRLGPLSFQPVELAKFALVLYLASFLTRRRQAMEQFWLMPPLLSRQTIWEGFTGSGTCEAHALPVHTVPQPPPPQSSA